MRPICAMNAYPVNGRLCVLRKVPEKALCDARRMPRAHPIRPHLEAWRRHFQKSQEWLANEIGTSHSTVQRYEKGKLGVSDDAFQAIARAYNITVAELSLPPDQAEKARQVHRVMTALQGLDLEGIAALATFAERLRPLK